jgi:exopolysaccharide biosynthesis polyprenyl glycosylphosphotransferase
LGRSAVYKRYKPYQIVLILADSALTGVVFLAAEKLRPFLPGKVILPDEFHLTPLFYITVLLLWHVLFVQSHVYDVAKLPFFGRQIGSFTSAYAQTILFLSSFLYFTVRDISRLQIIYFCAANYFVLLLARYCLSRYLQTQPAIHDRTKLLIVGLTSTGARLARIIQENHCHVYELFGFAGDRVETDVVFPAVILGRVEDVPDLCVERGVGLVLIAETGRDYDKIKLLIENLAQIPVRIYLAPDIVDLPAFCLEIDSFGNTPVIGIREPAIYGKRRLAKRMFDIALSSAMLLITWPLWIAVAVAIKLDTFGPAIFASDRVGENGRTFKMLKFRSMAVDSEQIQPRVTAHDEAGRPIFKSKEDPRVTRVGRWLRRCSLDELPQLINVLKGEMSLVGPRPEQPSILKNYESSQCVRLAVPPGITGLWQVSGRSDLPLHLNTQYDLFYVRNYSFLLDIRILLKTVVVVIQGKGAY